jgi:hypothetical protein
MKRDLSNKDLFEYDKIKEILAKDYFYYYPQYSLYDLNHIPTAKPDYIKNDIVRPYFANLDYRLIDHRFEKPTIIGSLVENANFLVTSIDQTGIHAPLNLHNNENIHPGKKRLTVARYVGLETVPVLLQSEKPQNSGKQLQTIDDFFEIYGPDIGIYVNDYGRLEVTYLISSMRDPNGYDDWLTMSYSRDGHFSMADYMLENGLEIYNSYRGDTVINGNFKTIYTTNPQNKIYIEILDDSLLDEGLDFWQLFFHIDPTVKTKTCKTGRIRIVNSMSQKDNLTNCSLYSTMIRKMY